MNEEESKISKTIPLRKATHKELMEVITNLHIQNYLKEMEIVRLNNIIKEAREYIELGINFDSLGVARTKRQLLEILDKVDKENI